MSHITSHSQRFQKLLWCHTDRTDHTDNDVRRKREEGRCWHTDKDLGHTDSTDNTDFLDSVNIEKNKKLRKPHISIKVLCSTNDIIH